MDIYQVGEKIGLDYALGYLCLCPGKLIETRRSVKNTQ